MQAKNMSMSPEFSGFLDFVRWMAALLVVLQHIRYLWFAEYADIQNKTILFKLFYFLTGFGSEAVMVFFVLSGFGLVLLYLAQEITLHRIERLLVSLNISHRFQLKFHYHQIHLQVLLK